MPSQVFDYIKPMVFNADKKLVDPNKFYTWMKALRQLKETKDFFKENLNILLRIKFSN